MCRDLSYRQRCCCTLLKFWPSMGLEPLEMTALVESCSVWILHILNKGTFYVTHAIHHRYVRKDNKAVGSCWDSVRFCTFWGEIGFRKRCGNTCIDLFADTLDPVKDKDIVERCKKGGLWILEVVVYLGRSDN